jgi:flavin-dependent dehydrogenase
VSGLADDRYRWFYRPGRTAGVVPTNDGRACVWAGAPTARFDDLRGDLDAGHHRVLAEAAPGLAEEIAGRGTDGPVRGFPGVPGFVRTASGPGWALVGDAGYFKDPLTAHGITDALRDAELLARAATDGSPSAFGAYERTRDGLTLPLLRVAEEIAAYGWDTARIRELLRAESAAMRPEVAAVRALDRVTWGKAA